MPIHPIRLAPFVFCLAGLAVAQGAMEDVVPGRDFRAHKLLTPGLTDTWNLDADADEMLWCVVESTSFDPVLELVDERGTVLGSDDGAGTRSELWLRAPSKGAYRFRVSPFKNSGGGNYSYFLHRFRTSPLRADGGEGTLTFAKERWWHWRVAMKAGDVLVPTVLGDGRLTAVLGPDRAQLAERFGGYRATRDGDCFVRVEGPEEKRCQLLTQLARGGDRPFGTRCAEQMAPYGLDTWTVRVPAGACIQVDVRMPGPRFGVDLCERRQPDLPLALVDNGHFDKGGALRRLYFARREVLLDVTLRNHGGAGGPYEFGVRSWGVPACAGATIDGHLPLGDGALFHLPLAAGEMVEVALASAHFDPKFDLLDPDGNQVVFGVDDRAPLDRDAFHRFLVTKPGTWHVLVHCCSGQASGAFVLRTTSTPLPVVVPGAATTVRAGDHLHLELRAGEVVWLSLRSGTFDAALQVVDPAGDAGFVAEGGGLGGDVLVAYQASHAGRHTLVVHARSGAGDGELVVVRP